MKCEICKKKVSDKFSLPWIHKECARGKVSSRNRTNPERIIQEYGVKELQKSKEGRSILQNARVKYKEELLQPNDPDFQKVYGKQIKEREERRLEQVQQANKMWGRI